MPSKKTPGQVAAKRLTPLLARRTKAVLADPDFPHTVSTPPTAMREYVRKLVPGAEAEAYLEQYSGKEDVQFDPSAVAAGVMLQEELPLQAEGVRNRRVYLGHYGRLPRPSPFEVRHLTFAQKDVRYVPTREWRSWK